MRAHRLPPLLALAAALLVPAAPARAAETVLDLSGTAPDDGLLHFFVDFAVPPGTVEIEIAHDDLSAENILDWGLVDEQGAFRGWGGGNEEPAVVGVDVASRSYLAGPIAPGTWRVVVGKAKVNVTPATFSLTVTLRDTPTLAAQPERAPYAPAAPLSSEARWYAGDFHVHSRESGDARPALDEIATYARSRGLDFALISDHNTTSQLDFLGDAQGRHPDFLFLPGVEFTTYAGHANGIGATTWVDHKVELPGRSIQAAGQAFRDQGALLSINHPTLALGQACIGCAWEQPLPLELVDAVEICTGKFGLLSDSALRFWDERLDEGRHLAALGGSDDHKAGQDQGGTDSPLGSPTTLVHATELSVEGILAGIRAGRTVVKFRGPDDPMIELSSSVAPQGDTVSTVTTELSATISGGGGLSARFVKNGVPEPDVELGADPQTITLPVTAPETGEDRYRVEVVEGNARRTVTSHLWVRRGDGGGSGAPPSASDASGCGCRGTRREPAGALSLLLLGLGAARKRARRPARGGAAPR